MTTDQFKILGEGHIAFQNARAHAGSGHVGFNSVLGKLHRRATVADGKQRRAAGLRGAGLELVLQGTVRHLVNQVVGTRSELNGSDLLREAGRCRKTD